jgi:hypothetical protein
VPGDEALQRSLALGRDIARLVRPEVPADSQLLIADVSTATLARARACVARADAASPHGVALVVRVVDAMGRARAAVPVEAVWRSRYLRVADAAWAWETDHVRAETDETGEAVLCELPRADRVQVRALVTGCAPVRATLRSAAGAMVNEIRLRLARDCGR